MENTQRKKWNAPNVESLKVKDITQTGLRRGRSRQGLKNGKQSKGESQTDS